jgi:hypothetical protein
MFVTAWFMQSKPFAGLIIRIVVSAFVLFCSRVALVAAERLELKMLNLEREKAFVVFVSRSEAVTRKYKESVHFGVAGVSVVDVVKPETIKAPESCSDEFELYTYDMLLMTVLHEMIVAMQQKTECFRSREQSMMRYSWSKATRYNQYKYDVAEYVKKTCLLKQDIVDLMEAVLTRRSTDVRRRPA